MSSQLRTITKHVASKLRTLGFTAPSSSVLGKLLETAFYTSIRTEESCFIRGSLTFADPEAPESNPPIRRRAGYPSFTRFRERIDLQPSKLVKLFRAVDRWSASIVVYGRRKSNIMIWGVLDQFVQQNLMLNRESSGGFALPGIVTVNIEGVGDISVYHRHLFLGRLRQDVVITSENDALRSDFVVRSVLPTLAPLAQRIAKVLDSERVTVKSVFRRVFEAWTDTVARICISLRRLDTGGSLLISASPRYDKLDIVHRLPYERLGHSMVLDVLDHLYLEKLEGVGLPTDKIEAGERLYAEADAKDRTDELTGALKVVASLASADGVVVLDPMLCVVGFAAKIRAGGKVRTVYDGHQFLRKKTKAETVDVSRFGTRHRSMLGYCREDRSAIGVVVSQDGSVRLINSAGKSLLMWNDVQLLQHEQGVHQYARKARRRRERRQQYSGPLELGYGPMPKTIRQLLAS